MAFAFDLALVDVGIAILTSNAEGTGVDSHIDGGKMNIVVHSMKPSIGIPTGAMMYIPISLRERVTGSPTLTLSDVVLANAQAQVLSYQITQATQAVTGKDTALPTSFRLHAARPNPFNPSTTIAYEVPDQAHITITVYNLLGQQVVSLIDKVQPAGRYEVVWDDVTQAEPVWPQVSTCTGS